MNIAKIKKSYVLIRNHLENELRIQGCGIKKREQKITDREIKEVNRNDIQRISIMMKN